MTTTEKPHLSRRTWILLAVAGVLVLSVLSIAVVNATASPAPKDYTINATGNVRASWYSETDVGKLDMDSGYGSAIVRAQRLSVSVDSTLPEGAYCKIEGPAGETYVDHVAANTAAHGLAAIVTATCSTK